MKEPSYTHVALLWPTKRWPMGGLLGSWERPTSGVFGQQGSGAIEDPRISWHRPTICSTVQKVFVVPWKICIFNRKTEYFLPASLLTDVVKF